MSAGSHRRLWIASTLLAAAGLAALISQVREPSDDSPRPARTETAAKVVSAAIARIDEESRGSLPFPAVEAAPGLPGRATDAPPQRPTPPEGYSFAAHGGEMSKARMDRSSDEPSDEVVPDWLDSTTGAAALVQGAAHAGRGWSCGWIRLADGASRDALERQMPETGGEVVGGSGRMIRARLPGDAARLLAIGSLDAVAGLGATPASVKLATFGETLSQPVGAVPVYVTLMAEDPDGRWRREMEGLGAVVGGYDVGLRTYRANADRDAIHALAEADFVLSVEPIPVVRASHDTAVPAMGADSLRAHDGAPGIFAGTDGATVPVGVMDTGLNTSHPDIALHRDSICGANFAVNGFFTDPQAEDDDLWTDYDGHGTHVTGTVAGNGFGATRFAGMAPGVRHIRFAKVLTRFGWGIGDSVAQGMDFLAGESGCMVDGEPSERVKPLIVNMSLSGSARTFEGRDVGARKLDSVVWSHRQLYVVAQSNEDVHGFSNYGAAKNSLSVGAATDTGALAPFSSHGPTADGRLAPNVVGTGVRLHSAKGDGSRSGYDAFSGTSMASPAVAGVAALLMDAAPAHKERPALTRALLMASAVRPDPRLDEGAGFALDNTNGPGPIQARFGMGKVSARTAVLDRDGPGGWRSGSATSELRDGAYAWHDIEVPDGASRLDVVMTWDEPPADAVASTVLNDLDLWLDRDGDCATAACGEHASRSRVDNVEWIVVRNPRPGTYRAKVLAHRVFTEAPRAALAWTVIRGASTPTLSVEADRGRLANAGEHELTLTLTADAYVAAGTRLHIDCRSDGASPCSDLVSIEGAAVSREDGLQVGLAEEANRPVPEDFRELAGRPVRIGASIPVGEIAAGDRRAVTLRVAVAEDAGNASLHFAASAWNAGAGSVAVALGPADAPETVRPDNDAFA
ncbi:MAG: S8 family peptidase, partial [Rhodospirillales bacterium]|nr:S8 family peptidase [Rhodospirillales bacterium]